MAKSFDLESALARLATLKTTPRSAETRQELTRALASGVNYLIESAAKFIREFKLSDFTVELAAAFNRVGRATGDTQYTTRTEIARTLCETGAAAPDVFLTGVRENARIGPPARFDDPAAGLRGTCIIALAQLGHPDALAEATDRLMDPAATSRLGAARAVGIIGREESAMILRLKLHFGEPDVAVLSEIFASLSLLDPRRSVERLANYLNDPDAGVAESAALALGESRRREALDALRKQYERSTAAEERRPLLLAIALTRFTEAPPFLITQVEEADAKTALHALDALKIYRRDEALRARAEAAVRKRGIAALSEQFNKLFH